jgi:hypothetical protein
MSIDTRPPWMTPVIYTDEAPRPSPQPTVKDDDPIDYRRRPDDETVFGDDLDDEDLYDEEGGQP